MEKHWRSGLFLTMIGVVFLIFFAHYQEGYTKTSPDEIYQSIGNFYAAIHEGKETSEFWPKYGEKIVLSVTLDEFQLRSDAKTHLSKDGDSFEVSTVYEISGSTAVKEIPFKVTTSVRGVEEESEVPVRFSLVFSQAATESEAEKLKNFRPGETVEIKGEVDMLGPRIKLDALSWIMLNSRIKGTGVPIETVPISIKLNEMEGIPLGRG